ncbi:MAG: DNA recombination protein RmuC [Proteobacteria bacterium]|nr:DNA recombination protein RmuC [Pseudomonadota bacterium]
MNEFALAIVAAMAKILPPALAPPTLLLLFAGGFVVLFFTTFAGIFYLLWQKRRLGETERKLAVAEQRTAHQEIRAAKLITLLKNDRKHATEKLQLLEDAREELSLRFAGLAQQIFDEKSARFSELNKDRLESILLPFNRQLVAFKQEINEIYRTDSRERLSLKGEILQLRDLNQQINREAMNLTRALKSDTKVQGNWGELVLSRVLEKSGLRLGQEYHTQGGFRDDGNRLLKPDVIIHLPEGRDIIVDSKVSLVSWERYVTCDDEGERAGHLARHVKAVRDHVADLGGKNYPGLAGIHSLDFVLMFMPIESAFSAIFQQDDSIFTEALAGNVIIVTPTTLLATLRTIENIWQYEQQSKNSQEIARRAGLMYDKFRSFAEEMEKIGKQLATCHATYDTAFLKLTRGRGNLVAHAEQLRELGVQTKKELPKSITDISDCEPENTSGSCQVF